MLKIYMFLLFGLVNLLILIPAPALSQPHSATMQQHIHPSLKVIMNGQEITLPGNIGIDPNLWNDHSLDRYSDAPGIRAPLHTHEDNDTLHVESTAFRRFTFGDFLDIWGIDQSKITHVTLDGKEIRNYKNLPLKSEHNLTLHINIDTSPENFTDYIDNESGLAFKYPLQWNFTKRIPYAYNSLLGEKPLYTITLSPSESKYLNSPYFYIDVEELPSNNITLHEYTIENLIRQLSADERFFPKVINSTITKLSGNPAYKLVVETNTIYINEETSTTYPAKHQKYTFIWTINNDTVYIVSFRGYSNAYSIYFPIIETIVNSIKLG